MALERSDVEKIAHLARLGLDEAELPHTTATLNSILQLIDQMQAVQTEAPPPNQGRNHFATSGWTSSSC